MSFIFLCFYYDLYVYGCCAVYQLKTVVYKGNLICPEESEKIHFVRNPYNKLASEEMSSSNLTTFNHYKNVVTSIDVPGLLHLPVSLRKIQDIVGFF